ncbi:hypothetical protein O7628_04070 [Micromonospora sp. WMMD956]|uniref:hypothetical protein n=1 Tax=Micromonospora sp. WMMD956 TaxID=3016108 RepID=UPI002416DA78|nr:hypothetical protein [Micromonospora sp. WMMD956]MDG4814689.1 hypothetical protein [Micromonospora sp. WMMD956]
MQQIERQLRLIAIFDAAEEVGLYPVDVRTLHTLAYLADALAPVWHLPILDGQVLKRRTYPFFPALQHDLDLLVGLGVVQVDSFAYEEDWEDGWRLSAGYFLNRSFADRIIDEINQHHLAERSHAFVREVVYAASAIGVEGIEQVGIADAAYSNPVVDVGGVVDIDGEQGVNATAKTALRFKALTREQTNLSDAETVHLYVRHLYSRMNVA